MSYTDASAVSQNTTDIAILNLPQTSLTAIGPVPVVKLEVEDGGTAAALQMYDMATPTHLVGSVEWLASTQELLLTLNDKDDGVVKAILEIKPDGTAYIGTGMVQERIATTVDIDNSGDLQSDGSIPMGAAYNPQSSKDIATVEYVQTATSGASHSYVVDTQADMLALTSIVTGDTCFVTAEVDPNDNGEFVAKIDDPVLIGDWAERENKTSWGGVIGTLGNQTDLQDALNLKADTTTVTTNTNAISAINAGTTPKEKTTYTDVSLSEPAWVEGQAYYANGTFNVHGEYAGSTLQLGQEQYIKVSNISGVDIPNGVPVYVTGAPAGLPTVDLAQADTFEKSRVIGMTTMIIPNNGDGLVTTIGSVGGLNTTDSGTGHIVEDLITISAGDTIFLSATEAGKITNIPPDIATSLGALLVYDLVAGTVFVKVNNHINPPKILAYMSGGVLDTATVTAAYQDVILYTHHDNVYMTYSETDGTITIPSTGTYRLTVNLGLLFDSVGQSEETFVLRVNGSISGNIDLPIGVGRNGGIASAYPSISFSATAGEVVKLQLGGATQDLTTLNETLMSFEIESSHVR